MNEDDNEENLYGIFTNFIRKLTDLFYTIIDENNLPKLPCTKFIA